MPRTEGSTNIAPFDTRSGVPVSSTEAIRLRGANLGPLEQFKAMVIHQRNYLKWLQSRHDRIIALKAELVEAQTGQPPARRGANDATHRKYFWFAECMALLDVINAFEFFYKSSCIDLAVALADIIPASQIKGVIEARFIWQSYGYSPQHLLFEHRLFHDLKYVNEATQMLIGKTYYQIQPSNNTYRCIHAVFQIRHTLSHNSGQMTQSDATKLRAFGFEACPDGVIDPGDDSFGESVFRFLVNEATSFTNWLEQQTVAFIHANAGSDGYVSVHKSHLLRIFNGSVAFDTLNLIPEASDASN